MFLTEHLNFATSITSPLITEKTVGSKTTSPPSDRRALHYGNPHIGLGLSHYRMGQSTLNPGLTCGRIYGASSGVLSSFYIFSGEIPIGEISRCRRPSRRIQDQESELCAAKDVRRRGVHSRGVRGRGVRGRGVRFQDFTY
ncbi:hypothetical protein J6590_001546 [Homalodisca vitripennis]|nr:hypothetical protein J6590_001546 [Homalodisca vitripennis]